MLTAIRDRLWAFTRRAPPVLCYTNGGLGDELMLTAVAHAARVAGRPLHLIATYPELWRGNTDPASLQTGLDRWLYAARRGWVPTRVVHLGYVTGSGPPIAQQMAEKAGLALPVGWRPILPPQNMPRAARRLVLQNSCRGARYAATTKEWPQARWHELVARLAPDFELIQVGTHFDPPLPGVEDRRGATTLRGVTDLIASAQGFVGLESGLMHVAAAVRTPAVIIVGGRTRAHETCYPFNRNITRAPACAGCGLNDGCPHQLMCLDISSDEVDAQIRTMMREPLPC
jgi:hypothetical protein